MVENRRRRLTKILAQRAPAWREVVGSTRSLTETAFGLGLSDLAYLSRCVHVSTARSGGLAHKRIHPLRSRPQKSVQALGGCEWHSPASSGADTTSPTMVNSGRWRMSIGFDVLPSPVRVEQSLDELSRNHSCMRRQRVLAGSGRYFAILLHWVVSPLTEPDFRRRLEFDARLPNCPWSSRSKPRYGLATEDCARLPARCRNR